MNKILAGLLILVTIQTGFNNEFKETTSIEIVTEKVGLIIKPNTAISKQASQNSWKVELFQRRRDSCQIG